MFIILEIIFTGYLAFSNTEQGSFCVTGHNCEEVQNSIYGEILGVKVSTLGLISFILLLIVFVISQRNKSFKLPK